MEKREKIIVFTDGGSRGNPGPAALGVAIFGADGNLMKEYCRALGDKTNNEAEYEAVIFALKKIKQLFGKARAKNMKVDVRMDSQLVCKQMAHQYKIEEEKLFPLFISAWNAAIGFGEVTFTHISREQNVRADALVNEALNGSGQRSFLK